TATVWSRDDDSAVLLNLVDGGTGTSYTLCDSVEEWVEAASLAESAVVDCADDSVQVGIGPDLDVAANIVE
ncbi:MAG TPA: hypothetical protein VGK83_07500, partial [Acidimicrobiia bacterium]